MDRAAAHVEAFNQAVTTGAWATFATRFAEDAEMSFPGLPIGPYAGRAAIAQAYRDNPPTETMTIIPTEAEAEAEATREAEAGATGEADVVRFRWASGSTGSMRLTWTTDGQVRELAVRFD
ncbi:SnoaL-like protein [Kribbella voronezhensis]|uniref:SnoaL-like protein n=1 Tax=Kribbella voronezhensis TaxID=2512212 RepID=A0A4R7SY86_9ACTN|nr:nuclear transport factor 2 family protein [Kribbella voronezhensis]TDU83467.1 SnoaL-like protein [Kribbella voronezhensis]